MFGCDGKATKKHVILCKKLWNRDFILLLSPFTGSIADKISRR